MPRKATGSVYESHGAWFASLSLPRRTSFRLTHVGDEFAAKERLDLMVAVMVRLRQAGHTDLVAPLLQQLGDARQDRLPKVLLIVDGVLTGEERRLEPRVVQSSVPEITFEVFARRWTSNELAQEFRRKVKELDHHDNISRLAIHVFPVVYEPRVITEETTFVGYRIGDIPMSGFTVEHADYVLSRTSLPEGSIHNVAALIRRVCRLASYPAKIIKVNPLPSGWAPRPNPQREKSFLYPSEEARLLAFTVIPLVRRLLYGVLNREGLRKENAVTIEWANLTLDNLPNGAGHIVLDHQKNGRGGSWALDPSTAEALRRWKTICPSTRLVFPAEAHPGHRMTDCPLYVDKLAAVLRDDLQAAGVTRCKLFESSVHRLRLRAHDLRGTFVTLALACGRSESWVSTRTGHRSSLMIARYRTEASTAAELNLGWLVPMHLAIPELVPIVGQQPAVVCETSAEQGQNGIGLPAGRQDPRNESSAAE